MNTPFLPRAIAFGLATLITLGVTSAIGALAVNEHADAARLACMATPAAQRS